MLELVINDPIDYDLLKMLYSDKEDLARAWPKAKFPLCSAEMSRWLGAGVKPVSLLFKCNDSFIGHVVLRSNDQNQLFLCFVLLNKQFRGQGLIYQVLSKVETFVSKNFVEKEIYLHVDPNNHAALRAYEKQGYEKIAVTDKGRFRMLKSITDEKRL
jgi:RimJ/RimL family protein N-acetyltransferase